MAWTATCAGSGPPAGRRSPACTMASDMPAFRIPAIVRHERAGRDAAGGDLQAAPAGSGARPAADGASCRPPTWRAGANGRAPRGLATGGTARAAVDLVRQLGGRVEGVAFLIELTFLDGRRKLAGENVFSVLQYAS